MKLGTKGSIGFLIGGSLAVISSIDAKGGSLFSGPIELFGGIALILFGLSRLLFVQDNNHEAQKNNRKTALIAIVMLLLVFAGTGYFRLQHSKPKKKEYLKSYGAFEVTLNSRTHSGEAILEGKKVTLQIKRVSSKTEIDGFRLYNKGIEIRRESISMVCALMRDLRVRHCSTGLDLPKNNAEEFLDEGFYTIMYWMREPLEDTRIADISFRIIGDNGEQNEINILEKK